MRVKPMAPHDIAAATGDYAAVSPEERRKAIHLNADTMDPEPEAHWSAVALGVGLWLFSLGTIAYCGMIR